MEEAQCWMLDDDMSDRSRLRALFRDCYIILLWMRSTACSPTFAHWCVDVLVACRMLLSATSPQVRHCTVVCFDQCERCNQSIKITSSHNRRGRLPSRSMCVFVNIVGAAL